MLKSKLETAISEAERFLERAKMLNHPSQLCSFDKTRFYGGKETGAVRRSSLDLSRALADLRRD